MPNKQVIEQFQMLTIWKNRGQRAPHKPLLLLLAISEMINNQQRYLIYAHIRDRLIELLNRYGPSRKIHKPNEPFSRLPKDGVWELRQNGKTLATPKNSLFNKELIENKISGGFTDAVWANFQKNPSLISEVISLLLTAHFTENYHDDILRDLALNTFFDTDVTSDKKTRLYTARDPKFRTRILEVYNYSCCICGYNLRITHAPIGLEAAHIKWHQAGGTDKEQNGLALCAIHHKLLDYGAITLDSELKIRASEKLNGDHEILQNQVIAHVGKSIYLPRNEKAYPKFTNIEWHVSEVFKG